MESIDRRLLLAAAVAVSERTLDITGTADNEYVEVALFENGQAQVFEGQGEARAATLTFNISDVDRVRFVGGDGNDVCILGRTPFALEFDGGAGDDAGSASRLDFNDNLVGGTGNDYLYGGGGNDFLDGGQGYDGMLGGRGDDYIKILSDDKGDDTVGGGSSLENVGIDTVDASDYNEFGTGFESDRAGVILALGDRTPAVLTVSDFIFEDVEFVFGTVLDDNISVVSGRPVVVSLGAGNDIFTGGRGNDVVNGGAGLDSLSTAGGDDIIVTRGSGIDEIDGGSGNDLLLLDRPVGEDNVSNVEEVRNRNENGGAAG